MCCFLLTQVAAGLPLGPVDDIEGDEGGVRGGVLPEEDALRQSLGVERDAVWHRAPPPPASTPRFRDHD